MVTGALSVVLRDVAAEEANAGGQDHTGLIVLGLVAAMFAAIVLFVRHQMAHFGEPGSLRAPLPLIAGILLLIGLAMPWLAPFTVLSCGPRGDGLLQCAVSERLLGRFALRERELGSVAGANYEIQRQSYEAEDSDGKKRTHWTTVEVLTLTDEDGGVVWKKSDSHLLGTSLYELAELVRAGVQKTAAPFVRSYTPWPPLLVSTLFVPVGVALLGARMATTLADRGTVPEKLGRPVFQHLPALALLIVYASAWWSATGGGR